MRDVVQSSRGVFALPRYRLAASAPLLHASSGNVAALNNLLNESSRLERELLGERGFFSGSKPRALPSKVGRYEVGRYSFYFLPINPTALSQYAAALGITESESLPSLARAVSSSPIGAGAQRLFW